MAVPLWGSRAFLLTMDKTVTPIPRAKDDVQNQMKDFTNQNVEVSGPVQSERQKLEVIAKSFGINPIGKTTDELREIISSNIGKKEEAEKSE